MGQMSKSSGLLGLKVSQDRVSQFASELVETHHHRCRMRLKLKTDGSMQQASLDRTTLPLSFSMH
jgi:hypothetical protein